jgi:hypothetical protein
VPFNRDDFADLMRAEKHRGRHGALDTETERLNRRIAAKLIAALEGPLEDYKYAISAMHEEGTPEFEALIRIWYEKHGLPGAQTP